MSKQEHTPGPYRREGTGIIAGSSRIGYCTFANKLGLPHGTVETEEEAIANADLFATAPDQRRIILALYWWLEEGKMPQPSSLMPDDKSETFEQAIRAALNI